MLPQKLQMPSSTFIHSLAKNPHLAETAAKKLQTLVLGSLYRKMAIFSQTTMSFRVPAVLLYR